MKNELEGRLFRFSVDVIKMPGKLKTGRETDVLKYQLSRSASSSGANYREAQAGSSKADFINKVAISLKEMRESNYWLEMIKEILPETPQIKSLLEESDELSKILAAILLKSRS